MHKKERPNEPFNILCVAWMGGQEGPTHIDDNNHFVWGDEQQRDVTLELGSLNYLVLGVLGP